MQSLTNHVRSERYKECTTKLATFLKGTGFNLKNDVFFMPIGMSRQRVLHDVI